MNPFTTAPIPSVAWSPDAELEIIGATLYAPELCSSALERLTPDHFYDPVSSRIWTAILAMHSAGQGLDPIAVGHSLGVDEGFENAGGIGLLADLIDKASPPAAGQLTDVLCDLFLRRALDSVARTTIDRARNTADASGEDILSDLEATAASISQYASTASAWIAAGDMVAQAIETAIAKKGLIRFPVGIKEIDAKLGGLNAGETTAVAGWTGMGKSIAGLQIAKANGSAGKGVAYFSLEMTEVPMAMRLACDIAFRRDAPIFSGETSNIVINKAIQGDLTDSQVIDLWEAQRVAEGWPIYFDTRPNLTVRQMEAATVRLHRKWAKAGIEPGPVIIDHIGKVRPYVERRGSVTAETRDVANDLDAMAKRLGVPVVVLSQLNRTVEQGHGKDKRPTLSSIKDSGALAENSRQVILLYRPEYYLLEPLEHEDDEAKADRVEQLQKVRNHFYWIIAKNSNGPPGQVLTYCSAASSAVRDWNP
ncbi:replicative DNA helicase [Brevundimonas vesicularis]|uniref:replicative DNA helicase n=1 Tax=Brevundimonas vesicularis TaxID=41276 RepID=UPI00142F2FC8|nr:replicative DNA helicase [Brevundimonas vesicularis]